MGVWSIMKNYATTAMCIVTALFAVSALHAEEDGWLQYHRTATGGALYYEPKSIAIEENVIDVWSKFVPAESGDVREMKHLVRFDCSRRKMKILNSNTYYRNGSLIELSPKHIFEPVEAGSSSEVLFNSVCSTRDEVTSLPTDTSPAH